MVRERTRIDKDMKRYEAGPEMVPKERDIITWD